MLLVSRSSRNQRRSILNFAPRIGLTVVDYGRLEEIDYFYLGCQNFRDYYRDRYNKLCKPVEFKKYYGQCGPAHINSSTKCVELLLQPIVWTREKQPILYPVEYSRELQLGAGIHLEGFHNKNSCAKYKR